MNTFEQEDRIFNENLPQWLADGKEGHYAVVQRDWDHILLFSNEADAYKKWCLHTYGDGTPEHPRCAPDTQPLMRQILKQQPVLNAPMFSAGASAGIEAERERWQTKARELVAAWDEVGKPNHQPAGAWGRLCSAVEAFREVSK